MNDDSGEPIRSGIPDGSAAPDGSGRANGPDRSDGGPVERAERSTFESGGAADGSTPGDDEAGADFLAGPQDDSDHGEFLAQLLGGVSRRARQLERSLRAMDDDPAPSQAQGAAELESERERIGWGLVVAAGLVGADGAPSRRAPSGPAWLATLVDLPAELTPAHWPVLDAERADWAAAHTLVRWLWELARAGVAQAPVNGTDGGGWSWSVPQPDRASDELLEALGHSIALGHSAPQPTCIARDGRWVLVLPSEWFQPGRDA